MSYKGNLKGHNNSQKHQYYKEQFEYNQANSADTFRTEGYSLVFTEYIEFFSCYFVEG